MIFHTNLADRIAVVCPIDGVSPSSNRIDFRPEATKDQRAAAQKILDAFDPAAEEAAEKSRQETEAKAIVYRELAICKMARDEAIRVGDAEMESHFVDKIMAAVDSVAVAVEAKQLTEGVLTK